MKKMILALMCMVAPSVFAQNTVENAPAKKVSHFTLDASFNASTKNSGKQLYNSTLRLSYTPAWRLGVVGEAGSSLMLFKKDGVKTWDEALTLGGGLTFRLGDLEIDDDTRQALRFTLTATMGCTVDADDWNYTYYDAGLTIMPTAEYDWVGLNIGFRHCNSHNNAIKNYNGAYVGLTFKF